MIVGHLSPEQVQKGILPHPMILYRPKGIKTVQNPKIPPTAGVYFLWSERELLYIGKSKNVRMRIAQHLGNAFITFRMVNPDEVKKVSVMFTKDEFDAERIEKQLLEIIPTKWNGSPFYEQDWYNDWRFQEGIFANQDLKINTNKDTNEEEQRV